MRDHLQITFARMLAKDPGGRENQDGKTMQRINKTHFPTFLILLQLKFYCCINKLFYHIFKIKKNELEW
jgi:hypothetical protein